MAKRKRNRKGRKPPRPYWLGPAGEGVEITWSFHARERAVERLASLGLTAEEIESHARTPHRSGREDPDPEDPDKIRRWSRARDADGTVHKLLFVFIVLREPNKATNDAGAIHMITVVDKSA